MATSTVRPGSRLVVHADGKGVVIPADPKKDGVEVELFVSPSGTVVARPVEAAGIDQDGSPDALDPRLLGIDQS